jgi:hypothetical protein
MKRMVAVVVGGVMLASVNLAAAGDRAVNGFILGAGSGALVGQALGRNTESTLIGTAVGGMVGYALASQPERRGAQSAGVSGTVVISSGRDHFYRVEERPRHYYGPGPGCRETEIWATIDGRPEIVVGTACWQNGEWVLANQYQRRSGQVVVIRNYPGYYRVAGPPPGKGWRKNHRDHYRR